MNVKEWERADLGDKAVLPSSEEIEGGGWTIVSGLRPYTHPSPQSVLLFALGDDTYVLNMQQGGHPSFIRAGLWIAWFGIKEMCIRIGRKFSE